MSGGGRLRSHLDIFTFIAPALSLVVAACSGGELPSDERSMPASGHSSHVVVGTVQDASRAHVADSHGAAARRFASRAYVDPETGQLGIPPPASQQGGAAASRSSSDSPPVVPNTSPAGGVMVDLRGTFSYGLRASTSEEGRVATRCDHDDDAVAGK